MLDIAPDEFDDSEKADEDGVPFTEAMELGLKHRATNSIADISRFAYESIAHTRKHRTTVQGVKDTRELEPDTIPK